MNREFDFRLDAKSFLPLFLAFYIPWLILEVLIMVQSRRVESAAASAQGVFALLLLLAALILLTVLLYIPILRKLVPAVHFEGEPYHFRGSIGKFLGLNLLGIFLTVITLGIYGPWYLTRISRYLVGEVSYKEQPLGFTGRGGRLFVIILLTIIVPMIPLILVQLRLDPTLSVFPAVVNPFQAFMLQFLAYLIFYSFMTAYLYLIYRWFFTNLRYGEKSLSWNTQFWPSVSLIWVQMLLSVLTLGIYLPAAYIKIYRYIVGHSEIRTEQEREGVLGFGGQTGGGFGLIWGQMLLTIITAGIYAPWALSKVGKWFLSNTYVEPS
jgi:uncharacterized membrane protein YjgN (DUF898 family)